MTVGMMAFVGVALIVVDTQERAGLAGFGVSSLIGALLLYRLDVRVPTSEERDSRLRRTPCGLEIRMRTSLPEMRVALPLLISATCFYTAWLLSYDDAWRNGSALLGVTLLLLVPDGVRGLLREGRLLISTGGLDVYGWNAQFSLAWDDVRRVHRPIPGQRNSAIRLDLHRGKTVTVRKRFFLLPLDFAAWGGRHQRRVRIASGALDEARWVACLAEMLVDRPAPDRCAIIDRWLHQRRACPAAHFEREFRTAVQTSWLPHWPPEGPS